jgi:1-deoxy-D-xylulose-5-phosphate synthase
LRFLVVWNEGFRFPRGNGIGVDLAAEGIGKDLKGTVLEVGFGC